MLERIATLTWRRPKLVLALVGVFVVVAGGLGYDVEHHLKAAGFTDSAPRANVPRAAARRARLRPEPRDRRPPVRAPDGGKLDVEAARRCAGRSTASRARLARRATSGAWSTRCAIAGAGAALIAKDGALADRRGAPVDAQTSRATAARPPRRPSGGSARARST